MGSPRWQSRAALFAALRACAITLALVTWSPRGHAHTAGISRGDYVFQDGRLLAAVVFARAELTDSLTWLVDRDGQKSLVAFEDQRERLGAWLAGGLVVSADGAACSPRVDAMRFDGDGIAFALAFACREGAGQLTVEARFISDLGRAHRHLAQLRVGERFAEFAATADEPSFASSLDPTATAHVPPPVVASRTAGRFVPLVRMGLEHILTGYDHLLFLVGLVLVGGPLRSLALAITAFTVSHSITLALAAFGMWAPSTRIVEPCIALSIAYIGVENWFVDSAVGRYKITLLFGLVHGFGFASALRAAAIPRGEIPLALLGFNLGVEMGQIAVIAVLLPLVLLVRKTEVWRRAGMRACAAAVALVGVAWFVLRLKNAVG